MSGLLDGAQLAMMRSLKQQRLHGSCTVVAVQNSGAVQTWPGAGVTVACTKGNPASGGDAAMLYSGDAPMARFWVPIDTVVKPGDRLLHAGVTYLCEGLPSSHADDLLRPVDCIEVRPPGGGPA